MNEERFFCALLLVLAIDVSRADTIRLSSSAPQQVRSCFQGTFSGYVASFDGEAFTVFVPLTGCDSKATVPPNCGPQIVALEKLPAEIRTAFAATTQVLHQKLGKDEVSSVRFGGSVQGQCVVPALGPPKRAKELPMLSWIAPTTSPEFMVAAKGADRSDKFGKFYGFDWGNQNLYGRGLGTGDEITLMKSDFKSSADGIAADQSIAIGGAVGFEGYGSKYVILGGRVTDVGSDRVKVKLERIDVMSLLTSLGSPSTPQNIRVDALEVIVEVVKGGQFEWDAVTGGSSGLLEINPRSIRVANGKRQIQVQSNAPIDGTLVFIMRRE